MHLRHIEILEKDKNKKGDLFGRLMSDLFHVLGYGQPRMNIHKTGREIDLEARHRTENKIAIAECKAHAATIGGDDINKFVGALDAEKRNSKGDMFMGRRDIIGYFISLSGFKETAIEQENECGNTRVILIEPQKIVEELIRGKILVSQERAITSLSALVDKQLVLLDYVDLLASEKGWVWVFYYSNSNGQQASHFALVHAEGNPLIEDLSQELVGADRKNKKLFKDLILLNKSRSPINIQAQLAETSKKYFKYLENELGAIQFEGMPTDKDAGSVKVQLENIFVPLHLKKNQPDEKGNQEFDLDMNEAIGDILSQNSKIAILAKPGGGKSTLIKRLAIAYAFPERRKQINDSLPDKNWFPIFLRCRELGNKVTNSITEIIHHIPVRAEIPACVNDFSLLVSNALQNGEALLLVDGLDEIAEDRNRIAFVNQLRTFIATYPNLNIIITSREAGFRVVAGSLSSYCENYTVSNLTGSEIEQLCLKWHKAIIDDSENTVREANKLSELILKDSKIKVLAENPLLLTTLLFVKRWAGYLPTKKSVLYQEMIKLLLVTWNVEGHEMLDIEEAEPQLAFVAYWMTKNGKQTISLEELTECLRNARKQMPEILGYTKINPTEFIKRVESRSSLLIMSGHKQLNSGSLSAVYEFMHLSFQEYLTAKAIVKKFIPQSDHTNVVDIIKPNINNENWKEVIPLTAVLLERDTKELIEYLIQESKMLASSPLKRFGIGDTNVLVPSLLGSCLANEVQISPTLLEEAIEWYAKNIYVIGERINTEIILKNKFGDIFREKVKELFFTGYDDKYSSSLGAVLGDIYEIESLNQENDEHIINTILFELKEQSKEKKCIAILVMMNFAFRHSLGRGQKYSPTQEIKEIFELMYGLLQTDDKHYLFSVCWCVAWCGEAEIFPEYKRNEYSIILTKIWIKATANSIKRMSSWGLCKILKPDMKKEKFLEITNLEEIIEEYYYKEPENVFDQLTSIYLGIIIGKTFDKEILENLYRDKRGHRSTLIQFARKLGIHLEK